MVVCVHVLDDALLRCVLVVWSCHVSGSHGTLGLHYGNPMGDGSGTTQRVAVRWDDFCAGCDARKRSGRVTGDAGVGVIARCQAVSSVR
jgi:hypothetical protein